MDVCPTDAFRPDAETWAAVKARRAELDHDPLPLLDQLRGRYGAAVSIEYRQRDPGAIVIDFVVQQQRPPQGVVG